MRKLGQILMFVGVIVVLALIVWLLRQATALQSPTIGIPDMALPQYTPTIYPSASTVIEQVQALSRLETASYHIEKVITAETGQGPLGFLFGDRLLLIAHGQIIAGIDLRYFGPNSVVINDDGTVYVQLPPTEVFVATLDNSRTYVYDRRTGVGGMNPQLETAARQEAERLVLQAALEDGILDVAEANARDFMRSLLTGLGFKHIIFVETVPTPTPAPTATPAPVTNTPGP